MDHRRRRCPVWIPVFILVATIVQLAIAQWWPGIERFADKAFGARLVAYPVLMLIMPTLWWIVSGRKQPAGVRNPPYGAFALIMLPFLVDVTGNSADLYDRIDWWDDANHFVNWLFLLAGVGLLIGQPIRPGWARVLSITGLGAVLALAWELGEWFTFIRHGTEIATAYEDTLGDMALGTVGALAAAILVHIVLASRGHGSEVG